MLIAEAFMHTTIWRGYASHELPHIWQDGNLIRSWARMGINWCYRSGIMQGTGQNSFAPNDTYTREQAISTILRLYYAYGQAEKLASAQGVDYYPIYKDSSLDTITGWFDSSLTPHTCTDYSHMVNPNTPDDNNVQVNPISPGYYALYASDGQQLSAPYPHALVLAGENLFLGWVGENPSTYDILYCDGNDAAQVIRREIFRDNASLVALGNGTYAVQNTDTQITIFDHYGDTISVLQLPEAGSLCGNGQGLLIVAMESSGALIYFTPEGKNIAI